MTIPVPFFISVCLTSFLMISLISFFSKIKYEITFHFIRVSKALDKHMNVRMMLVAPFREILKIIIIVRSIFYCKIFSECLSHVINLAVLSLIFYQRSSIDNLKFLKFRNRTKPYICISHYIIERIMFEVQVFNIFKVREFINYNCFFNVTALDRQILQINKSCNLSPKLCNRVLVQSQFFQFGQILKTHQIFKLFQFCFLQV